MNTFERVKEQLYDRRYTIRSWAIRNGYNPRTVDNSLRRSLKNGKMPRGVLARAIVKGIEATIDEPLFEMQPKKRRKQSA